MKTQIIITLRSKGGKGAEDSNTLSRRIKDLIHWLVAETRTDRVTVTVSTVCE